MGVEDVNAGRNILGTQEASSYVRSYLRSVGT